MLVAIYWGMEYALLSGRLTISKSGHIDWNASPHAKGATPPVDDSAAENAPANRARRFPADDPKPAAVDSPTDDATSA